MYALNLAEDNHILSASFETEETPPGQPLVEALPPGDITDYRYEDGEYVYDPLPEPVVHVTANRNYDAGNVFVIDGVMYEAISAIPNGGAVIVGQNAIVTSLEEQLAKLKGEST